MSGAAAPMCSVIERAVLRKVCALGLPAGARILDAPCGSGALATALAEEGFEVWGADVEPSAAAVLAEQFRQADLEAGLPWPDGSFDAVLCVEGVEHLENRFAFFREARRVLRAEGTLIITTPNIVAARSRVRFFGSGFFGRDPRPLNESGRHPLHHIGLATFPELRYELRTTGFRLVEVGHTHTKPVNYAYAIWVPWMWLYTLLAFRKEKNAAQRERNFEIRRTLFSRSLLFGENLLLMARKTQPAR